MSKKIEITGYIESLLIATQPNSLISTKCNEANLTIEGFEGDNHAGITMRSNSRTPHFPRGTVIRNSRQVSLVSVEELTQIAQEMKLPHVLPEWLGANLLVKGVPNLTQVPPSTRLFFPQDAVVVIEAENFPCTGPARLIQAQFPEFPNLAAAFMKYAMHKRGLVGWVERPGQIKSGDKVRVEVMPQIIYSIA